MHTLSTAVFGIHLLWVLFIIGTIPLVVIGNKLGWCWIRSRSLRYLHLAAIGFVVVETVFEIPCPLTWLENYANHSRGAPGYSGDGFIMDWFDQIIGLRPPATAFDLFYLLLFAAIFSLFILIPPNKRRA